MINIDNEEYFKLYKELYVHCLNKGEIIPNILTDIIIPVEYRFTVDEKRRLDNGVSAKNKLKIYSKLLNRRQDELELIHYTDYMDRINEYNENELLEFVGKYPYFKSIIK